MGPAQSGFLDQFPSTAGEEMGEIWGLSLQSVLALTLWHLRSTRLFREMLETNTAKKTNGFSFFCCKVGSSENAHDFFMSNVGEMA